MMKMGYEDLCDALKSFQRILQNGWLWPTLLFIKHGEASSPLVRYYANF